MKNLLLCLSFVALPFAGSAQCIGTEWLLIDLITTMEEGGPQMKMTFYETEPVPIWGLRGGWPIHDDLVLGLAAYGTSTTVNSDNQIGRTRLEMGYAGMFIDKRYNVYRPVHYSTSLFLGYGASDGLPSFRNKEFFVVEPEGNILFRIADEIRVGVGGSYRVFVEQDGISNLGLANFNVNFMVLFGGI